MKSYTRGIAALLAAFAVAACEEGTGPGDEFDAALNEDAAVVAADAALEDLASMVVPAVTPALALAEASAPLEASRSWTYFNAEGGEQDAYNPETTASIRIVTEMSGTVERDGWSATVERSRDMTVSGLEGEETSRTWNGTGSGLISGSRHSDDSDVSREYEMTTSSLVENVVVNLPREEYPYPMSGTITRTISATFTHGDKTETRTRTAVLTFDGGRFATLTVGDQTYEVDLDARKTDRPVRKR